MSQDTPRYDIRRHDALRERVTRLALLVPAVLVLCAWTEPRRTMAPTPIACAVVRVLDGDTIDASCETGAVRVRLRGVDTPERGEQRHHEATAALHAMLARCGWQVTLVPHHMTRGRIAASVNCHGINVGRAMDAAVWSKPVGARR